MREDGGEEVTAMPKVLILGGGFSGVIAAEPGCNRAEVGPSMRCPCRKGARQTGNEVINALRLWREQRLRLRPAMRRQLEPLACAPRVRRKA